MKERVFEDEHGRKLIVRMNRSDIQIHTERKELLDYRFYLDNIDLLKFLKEQAEKVWKTFTPKEVDSFGSDYFEFYDRGTDANGYLEYHNEMLIFESPSEETTLLYQFNKRKMESFIYDMDIRKAVYAAMDRGKERKIEINPDIQADWKSIPFDDETFDLIVFDPPHLVRAGKTSWLAKKYGTLDLMTWPNEFYKAFQEIMRVLKPNGTMIFKWNEDQIPVKEVFKAFGQQPILGDMKSKTKWSVFIKNETN